MLLAGVIMITVIANTLNSIQVAKAVTVIKTITVQITQTVDTIRITTILDMKVLIMDLDNLRFLVIVIRIIIMMVMTAIVFIQKVLNPVTIPGSELGSEIFRMFRNDSRIYYCGEGDFVFVATLEVKKHPNYLSIYSFFNIQW